MFHQQNQHQLNRDKLVYLFLVELRILRKSYFLQNLQHQIHRDYLEQVPDHLRLRDHHLLQ